MTKPMVFNYADHERALEEIARLKEDIANLQIRCRIAESEKPDRDCKHCKHLKPDGCSRWDCEYEPVMSDLISRADAIEAIASRDETDGTVKAFTGREVNGILSALPSADAVATFSTGQTYGKSTSIRELVEVVRCKDCRYFKKIAERSDSGLCHRDIVASAWKENGYCSRGERREP